DLAAAAQKLGRQGLRREQMAARPARGEHDRGHAGCASRRKPNNSVCCSPIFERRRVSASAKPMVSATANSDEPPYEMNGSVIPFAGSMLTATPMLMNACSATTIASPAPARLAKLS